MQERRQHQRSALLLRQTFAHRRLEDDAHRGLRDIEGVAEVVEWIASVLCTDCSDKLRDL